MQLPIIENYCEVHEGKRIVFESEFVPVSCYVNQDSLVFMSWSQSALLFVMSDMRRWEVIVMRFGWRSIANTHHRITGSSSRG